MFHTYGAPEFRPAVAHPLGIVEVTRPPCLLHPFLIQVDGCVGINPAPGSAFRMGHAVVLARLHAAHHMFLDSIYVVGVRGIAI